MNASPQQLDAFDSRHLARKSDPQTSHQAAARVHEFAGGHREQILACLKRHGSLTVDEIAKRTRLQSQAINKRLPELERAGLARPTGGTRLSASGRPERVWYAT